jgi:hypothetical protein
MKYRNELNDVMAAEERLCSITALWTAAVLLAAAWAWLN